MGCGRGGVGGNDDVFTNAVRVLTDGIPLAFDRTPLLGIVFAMSPFLDVEKGIHMVDRRAPGIIAIVWQQVAEKVAALKRDGTGDAVVTWNDVIGQAEALLRKEAEDALFMARMAHLLIVGNVAADDTVASAS